MAKDKTWGDVYWSHIIASKGMMDRCDAAYRADRWLERKGKKQPTPPYNHPPIMQGGECPAIKS